MSNEILSLIEQGRRVLIELMGVFDDILIKCGRLRERTIPSREDRQLLRKLKEEVRHDRAY